MPQTKKKHQPRAIPRHERKRKRKQKQTTAITRAEAPTVSEAIEKVLIGGDLAPLTPEDRLDYYKKVCRSLGLNPLTQPFGYILFKENENSPAKLVLYAKKDCAEQLRKIHCVSVIPGTVKRTIDEDYATVEIAMRDGTGKTDVATGVVYLWKKYEQKMYRLSGQRLADAVMKAETKAKRRGTLSICGLGILDEHDLESMRERVVGGITAEGRVFEYEPRPDPDDPNIPGGPAGSSQDIESLRSRGLWCDEHQCIMNGRHIRERHGGASQALPERADKPSMTPIPPPTEKPSPSAPERVVYIDFTEDETSPIIRWSFTLDTVSWLTDLQAIATFRGDWYHVESRKVEAVKQLARRYGYEVQEIVPKPKPPAPPAKKPEAQTSRIADASVEGIIEQTIPKQGKSPGLDVLFKLEGKKYWMRCFDQKWFEPLAKGKNPRPAVLVIRVRQDDDKIYRNIVAVKSIGSTFYDQESGKPEIQQSQREAGGKTLFGG